MATPISTGAAERRRKNSLVGTTPQQPMMGTAGATDQGPNHTPIAPSAGVAIRQAQPFTPDQWQNPYPTAYTHVPIAAPPASDFPDLLPEDMANLRSEFSQFDSYLAGLDLQASQASQDTSQKVAGLEQALARGLEATNWNMAARGLGASSIKDQSKTQQASDTAAAKGGEIGKLQSLENYTEGERNRINTVDAPAAKERAGGLNRQRYKEAHPDPPPAAAEEAPPPPGAPAPAAPPEVVGSGPQPTTGGPGVYIQTSGPRAGLRYTVKNGKRYYESRAGAGDWGKGGVIAPPNVSQGAGSLH